MISSYKFSRYINKDDSDYSVSFKSIYEEWLSEVQYYLLILKSRFDVINIPKVNLIRYRYPLEFLFDKGLSPDKVAHFIIREEKDDNDYYPLGSYYHSAILRLFNCLKQGLGS
jgi:hypothetical protein